MKLCGITRYWPALLGFVVTIILTGALPADAPRATETQRPATPSTKRIPWTTSTIQGSPETPLPYTTERAFPGLQFNECLDITRAPGSDRLFVVEHGGKILSFPNQPDIKSADLVVDLAKKIEGVKEVYSLAFHPDFQKNRYCYVCYIKAPNLPDGSHIARFEVSNTIPPTIDVATEKTIITWLSGGHNGCCLKFGPDGFLYISTGDGSGPNPPDGLRAGQDVSNVLSSILRIDIDHTDGDRNYRVPADNPFVDLIGARPEIWAYGFRNPWRMSFDAKTGDLWVGDVGWELWELLDRVERGGNYGWSVMEGRQATNPEWTRGPTPILPPTIDHPHSESSSITDGLTYYGTRLPELSGHHLYGDYDTGKIWSFRYQEGRVVEHRELADTTHRIVGFGEDASGECFILDHTGGSIHRLIANPLQGKPSTFPRKLSDSGLFTSVSDLQPAPGVIPYTINAEAWADHASAIRLAALPNDSQIANRGTEWTFPKDSVMVKTLTLEMKQGDPSSQRRIETQILHFDGSEWQPYTYQWNAEQTDATLVAAAGLDQTFDVTDPDATGGVRKQTWRFAGRAECQRCHNKWSGSVLSFNTPQLNKPIASGAADVIQLDLLTQLNLFEKPIPVENRPRLTGPHHTSATLDDRARAYLHANCSHCHRLHAGGAVLSKMHFDLPLEKTDMLGVRPTQGTFGIHSAQVIAPGDPFRSVLLYRMAKLGGGRMPHIGSSEVDRAGVELIANWIQQLDKNSGRDKTGLETSPKLRLDEAALLKQLLTADSLPDNANDPKQAVELQLDRLLASTSGAMLLLQSVDQNKLPPAITTHVIKKASQHSEGTVRDLFERYLAPEQRLKRLGNVIHPDQILSLTGDSNRGKSVFFENAGVSCKNCHRIGKEGKEIGPELTQIGKKLTRIQLLESILEPSKLIDPKFVTYLAETTDGRLTTGLLQSRDAEAVVLKDAQDQQVRLATSEIEQLVPQRQSLMPDLLLKDLTAQQVADLLEYLSNLK